MMPTCGRSGPGSRPTVAVRNQVASAPATRVIAAELTWRPDQVPTYRTCAVGRRTTSATLTLAGCSRT